LLARLPQKHEAGFVHREEDGGIQCHPDSFAMQTTSYPALISHEAAGNSRRRPQIPARRKAESPALARKALLSAGNPRLSPLSPEAPRPACHAGGRGFESRRSRSLLRLLGRTGRGHERVSRLTGQPLQNLTVGPQAEMSLLRAATFKHFLSGAQLPLSRGW
jgi:hypothetical protein